MFSVFRENVARYLAHPPIVLDRIVGDSSAGKILYTGETIHPRHRANFRVFDPLAFLLISSFPAPHRRFSNFLLIEKRKETKETSQTYVVSFFAL